MIGIRLIVTLVIMGGAIAYFGNQIGRRIGRRRLSLFGMRPKHSSILMTILTGMIIATFSLTLLSIASEDVRTALFDIGELQATLKETRQRADEIVRSRDAALEETERLKAEAQEALAALNAAERHLQLSEEELEARKADIVRLHDLTRQLEENIAQMERTEEKLRHDVATLSTEYVAMERSLRSGSFVFLKDEIVAATVVQGRPEAHSLRQELNRLLREAGERAAQQGIDVSGTTPSVVVDDDEFERAVQLLSSDTDRWVVRLTAAQNTMDDEQLLTHVRLFPRRLIYRAGEQIGRTVVDDRAEDVEEMLLDLIEGLNNDALRKGMITSEDGSVSELSGEQLVEALLTLRRASGPMVVKAIITEDTWNTEGPLRFRLAVAEDGET